jgi:hypothetical protein
MRRAAMAAMWIPIASMVANPSHGDDKPVSSNKPVEKRSVSDIVDHIPADVTVAAVVRVRDILDTPRAKAEKWSEQSGEFLAGAMKATRGAYLLLRGIELDLLKREVSGVYTLAWLLPGESFKTMADSHKWTLETVGKTAVAQFRPDGWVGEIEPGLLGAMTRASRREFVRWLRSEEAHAGVPLAGYLRDVVTTDPGQVVLALDLADVFDRGNVKRALQSSESLKSATPAVIDALTSKIMELRGIRISITINTATQATLSVDFATTVTAKQAENLSPIFLESMGHAGMMLPELESATGTPRGNSLTYRFEMSDSSLRQVVALLQGSLPAEHSTEEAAGHASNQTAKPASNDAGPSVARTADYYRNIVRMLSDLEKQSSRGKNPARTAQWYEQYATRINQLPLTGVDASVVDFGARTASMLRAIANSLRGVAIKIDTLNHTAYYAERPDPGGMWGGGGVFTPGGYFTPFVHVDTNIPQVRSQQAQAIIDGAGERDAAWKEIADDRSRVRREMYDKYRIDLDTGSEATPRK